MPYQQTVIHKHIRIFTLVLKNMFAMFEILNLGKDQIQTHLSRFRRTGRPALTRRLWVGGQASACWNLQRPAKPAPTT